MLQKATTNKRAFIFTSITEISGLSLTYRDTLFRGLVLLGESAYGLRQWGRLRDVSNALFSLPLSEHQAGIAYYLAALNANPIGQGDGATARRLLELAAELAPADFRARALLSLATQHGYNGNRDLEVELCARAARSARDPLTSVETGRALAILQAEDGDHRRALELLESLWPMVRSIAAHHPVAYLDYLNSLAVELSALGRLNEARQAARIALASQVSEAYPEWRETARQIEDLDTRSPVLVVPASDRRQVSSTIRQTDDRRRKSARIALVIRRARTDKAPGINPSIFTARPRAKTLAFLSTLERVSTSAPIRAPSYQFILEQTESERRD